VLNEMLYYMRSPRTLLERVASAIRPDGIVLTSIWRHPGIVRCGAFSTASSSWSLRPHPDGGQPAQPSWVAGRCHRAGGG